MTITNEGYSVNDHNIIDSPGKFEGEHASIPHFWDAALDSSADEDVYVGDTTMSYFILDENDRKQFPDLTQYGLCLWESDQGFVNALWFDTEDEYSDHLRKAYDEASESEDE